MEKDKKYNVVLGLMIFFFVIIVGVCLAFGLGIITIGKDKNLNSEAGSTNTNVVNQSVTNNTSKKTTDEEKEVDEMTVELAYGILNKYKNEKLPDARWYIGKVKLVAHGDNNSYWVSYEEENLDGYTTTVGAIIQYKNGEWITELPGFSGISQELINKHNFVNY